MHYLFLKKRTIPLYSQEIPFALLTLDRFMIDINVLGSTHTGNTTDMLTGHGLAPSNLIVSDNIKG